MKNKELLQLVENNEAKFFVNVSVDAFHGTIDEFIKEFPYCRNWYKSKTEGNYIEYDGVQYGARGLKTLIQKQLDLNEEKLAKTFHVGGWVYLTKERTYGEIVDILRYIYYDIYKVRIRVRDNSIVKWCSMEEVVAVEEIAL